MLVRHTCIRDFDLFVKFDRLLCSHYSLSANKLHHGIGDAGMVGHGKLWPKKDTNLAQIGIVSMKSICLDLYNKVSCGFIMLNLSTTYFAEQSQRLLDLGLARPQSCKRTRAHGHHLHIRPFLTLPPRHNVSFKVL